MKRPSLHGLTTKKLIFMVLFATRLSSWRTTPAPVLGNVVCWRERWIFLVRLDLRELRRYLPLPVFRARGKNLREFSPGSAPVVRSGGAVFPRGGCIGQLHPRLFAEQFCGAPVRGSVARHAGRGSRVAGTHPPVHAAVERHPLGGAVRIANNLSSSKVVHRSIRRGSGRSSVCE